MESRVDRAYRLSRRVEAYVLYGQPVYLFGLLLCVFCPAYLLKHIRDFGMAEKPMDPRIKSGAKGAVACRFVLWASRLQGHLSYTHIISYWIIYHIYILYDIVPIGTV